MTKLTIHIPTEWLADIKLQCKSLGIPIQAPEGYTDGPNTWIGRMVGQWLGKFGKWPPIVPKVSRSKEEKEAEPE